MPSHDRLTPHLVSVIAVILGWTAFVSPVQGQSPPDSPAATGAFMQRGATADAPAASVDERQLLAARLQQIYATADFNQDGLQDIAFVDFLADSVLVMTANPAGSFRAESTLATRRGPRSIVAADFNGDGLMDLAVAEFLSGHVRIFAGRGTGQFDVLQDVRIGVGVNSLVAKDFNDDLRPDIVVANALSGGVSLLINRGDGPFGEPAEIGRLGAVTVLSADIDGDGILDIAGIDLQGTASRVFAGLGAARFMEANPLDTERVLSAAHAEATRTSDSASHYRLEKVAGDGVALPAGADRADPLLIEVQDPTGAPVGEGHTIVFSRVGGTAESGEPSAPPTGIEDARATDADGRVSLALALPALPAASIVAAAAPSDQVAHFGVLSVWTPQKFADALDAALALEVSDSIERAERADLVRQATQRLNSGETMGGVRILQALLNQLPSEQVGAPDAASAGRAADLLRRFINQLLLIRVNEHVADDETLPCDTPLTRSIDAATDVRRFGLACQTGEVVHIVLTELTTTGGAFDPAWRLMSPSGAPAAVCGTWSYGSRDCSLPAAGSYTVEVSDYGLNGTGTYGILLQRLTAAYRCDGGSLICDTSLTTAIDAYADTDLHNFTGVTSEVVHIVLTELSTTSGAFDPAWRLISPGGAAAAVCGTWSYGSRDCSLPAAGTYAVEVSDYGFNGAGTYGLHLQRLTSSQRCDTGSLACDESLTATVADYPDTDLHNFTGVAGEVVQVVLTELATSGGSFDPAWRLISPSGAPAAVCGTWSYGSRDCSLPAAGSYAVQVSDYGFNGTGTYGLHLQRLTGGRRCDTGALACNTAVTATIDAYAETDLHNFTGVASEVLQIVLTELATSGGSFDPAWRLIAPSGAPAAVCGTWSYGGRDCSLPVAGSYAVQVSDYGFNGSGTYGLQFQRLTAAQRCDTGSLPCDTRVAATIDAFADTDLHNFTGTADEVVQIVLTELATSGGSFDPAWRLIASMGTPASVCGTWSYGTRDCRLPAAGSYAVQVSDYGFNGTGTYGLLLQRLTATQRCGGSLTCGVPLTTTIDPIGDTDLHTFRGVVANIQVTFANNGGSSGFDPMWRLIAPDGTPASACGTWSYTSRSCNLPAAGDYAVEVRDGGDNATGTYTVTVAGLGCPAGADLVISALSAPAKSDAGRTISVKVTTRNLGTGQAGETNTRLYLSSNNKFDAGEDSELPPVAPVPVPGLASGAFSVGSKDVTIPASTAPGKHFIIAVSDADHTQPESNEANNARAKAITIGPDLIVSAIVAPASATPGATISVTVTTKNKGGGPAGPSKTWVYFSNNSKVDAPDGEQKAAIDVALLGPGATDVRTVTVTIPTDAPIGTRYLIAVADAPKQVLEANERNNVKPRKITIQ